MSKPTSKTECVVNWLAAGEAALDHIATRIAPKFGVSAEVIAKRSRVEKLWPP
jgi:hypothetical protein